MQVKSIAEESVLQYFRPSLSYNLPLRHLFCLFLNGRLSLSHTEHGWAHVSNMVYSVIHGLTGTSIELKPCLGMSWYDLDSNVARVCTNNARIYSIKQGWSRFAKRFS